MTSENPVPLPSAPRGAVHWTEPEFFKKLQGLLVRKTWTAFQVRLKELEIMLFIRGFICFLDSDRNLKTWTEPEIFKKLQRLLVRKTWAAFQVRLKEPETMHFNKDLYAFWTQTEIWKPELARPLGTLARGTDFWEPARGAFWKIWFFVFLERLASSVFHDSQLQFCFNSITWFLLWHRPKDLAQCILLPPRQPEISPAHAGSRSSERRRPPPSELCLLVLRTLAVGSENFGRGFWEPVFSCYYVGFVCIHDIVLKFWELGSILLRTWPDTSENFGAYFWELGPILLRTLVSAPPRLEEVVFWDQLCSSDCRSVSCIVRRVTLHKTSLQ